MWHGESGQWIMSLAVGDHAEFYSSRDLKSWTYLSEFGMNQGAHGGVWECPDLVRMKVEGHDEEKWVLLISINPGGPNGGSATQYFVGEFDGTKFTTDQKEAKWVDHGADNYAGVTFNNAPGEKPIFIGWMSNWNYALNTPTEKWRSAMTLPRHLLLSKDEFGYFISSRIFPAFDDITTTVLEKDEILLDQMQTFDGAFDRADITWSQDLNEDLVVKFLNNEGEFLVIELNPEKGQIIMDRQNSGKTDFSETFADKQHVMPYYSKEKSSEVRIVLDRASIELFVDGGRYVMTEKFFPNAPFNVMQLSSARGTTINQLKIKSVANTWKNE
jgi:fructan beta-fructosidase